MTRVLVAGTRHHGSGIVTLTVEERPSWFARVFLGRLPVHRVYQGQSRKWRELPTYRWVRDHEVLYQLRCLQSEWIERENAERARRSGRGS